jgi:ribonuclease J
MEICTIGGYEEVGKNMTAVKVGEEVIIFDIGIYLPSLIGFQQEQEELQDSYNEETLRKINAIPDDTILDKKGWSKKVKAIVIGHAHLDHVGAVPYLAHRYPNAKIIGTPFTIEVLDTLIEDSGIKVKNKKIKVKEDSTITIKGEKEKLKLEFIRSNHSTIQTAFVVWHSKEGKFFYSLDFKFDKHPILGKPPNYKRLKELGKKEGVKCLIADSLYADSERRTRSERIARYLLEDVMSNVRKKDSAFFITTFSSHIARLKSIVDFAQKTNREIIFLGRSMNKYVKCAINVGMCPFKNKIKLLKYRGQINSFLKKVEKNRGKYLVVCTGHQGENGSVLDRIAKGETPFEFKNGDAVIFSSKTIPVPQNLNAKEQLDKRLKKQGVRIQSDVHVSGHAGREDLRDLVEMINPKHIIPAHAELQKEVEMIELAGEMGYNLHENAHLSSNGKTIKI